MIDPDVAYEKLAGFATPAELADFFRGEGIKGRMGQAAHCPMAEWLTRVCETPAYVDNEQVTFNDLLAEEDEDGTEGPVLWSRPCTDAMYDFIEAFDERRYPDLLADPNQKTPSATVEEE